MTGADVREQLIVRSISKALQRARAAGRPGIHDPRYSLRQVANPRYQEVCLTLAVAAKLRIGLPKQAKVVDVEFAASRAINGWFMLLEGNGWVPEIAAPKPDPIATAYGGYAIARTLLLLGDLVPGLIRDQAKKHLKRVGRYLAKAPCPAGVEMPALRFVALTGIRAWNGDSRLDRFIATWRQKAHDTLELAIKDPSCGMCDAGAFGFTLALLAMEIRDPDKSELILWRRLIEYCKTALLPNGLYGGGAEANLTCLPLTAGFELVAEHIPEAFEVIDGLDAGWEQEWYNAMLDPDVPQLTPLSYLTQFGLAARRDWEEGAEPSGIETEVEAVAQRNKSRLELADWSIRFAPGYSISSLFHHPSGSARIWSSPVGHTLQEGPWRIHQDLLYHPAYGFIKTEQAENPWRVDGGISGITLPGTVPNPLPEGFPLMVDRLNPEMARLFPLPVKASVKGVQPLAYRREIEMKDGALTIETYTPDRISHRLPVIWPGGEFGIIRVGGVEQPADQPLQMKKVRECSLMGGLWPTWKVRFDRPVDLMYEPVIAPVAVHPLRYLSAAAGVFDFIASDRLHMAWRVVDD